jgi:hypothetical protein
LNVNLSCFRARFGLRAVQLSGLCPYSFAFGLSPGIIRTWRKPYILCGRGGFTEVLPDLALAIVLIDLIGVHFPALGSLLTRHPVKLGHALR